MSLEEQLKCREIDTYEYLKKRREILGNDIKKEWKRNKNEI